MTKVLIIDDSPIVTKMIDSLLSARGYRTDVMNSPFGVTNKIKEFRPQIVLLDLGLPGINGKNLLKLFPEIHNERFRTIVVSSAEESELKELVDSGMAGDYHIKGDPMGLLLDKIARQVKLLPPPSSLAGSRFGGP